MQQLLTQSASIAIQSEHVLAAKSSLTKFLRTHGQALQGVFQENSTCSTLDVANFMTYGRVCSQALSITSVGHAASFLEAVLADRARSLTVSRASPSSEAAVDVHLEAFSSASTTSLSNRVPSCIPSITCACPCQLQPLYQYTSSKLR